MKPEQEKSFVAAKPLPAHAPRKAQRGIDRTVRTRRDPQARLIRQLLALTGEGSRLVEVETVPWASVTFVGARHHIAIEMDEWDVGLESEYFAELLPDIEFRIAGHLVADAVVDSREGKLMGDRRKTLLRITVLTIEDW